MKSTNIKSFLTSNINKLIVRKTLFILFLSFSVFIANAQNKDKLYDSPEDSVERVQLKHQLEEQSQLLSSKYYELEEKSPKMSINKEYSGLFYLNAEEAIYSMRFSYNKNFIKDIHKFKLKIDFINQEDVLERTITEKFDTVDCGSFIIRIPKIISLKKIKVSYVDNIGRISVLDNRDISYSQNELMDISNNLYDKSSRYFAYNAVHKEQAFPDFILNTVNSSNVIEGLSFVQNQFNIFPPIDMTGSLGGSVNNQVDFKLSTLDPIPPFGTKPINPCDTAFISKWINSMKKLYGFENVPYYQIVRCLTSDKYDLLKFFDEYVKSILPSWQGWKKTCYKGRLKGGEMPCDCQRTVPVGNIVNSGSRFEQGSFPFSTQNGSQYYRGSLSNLPNGQRNPNAVWKTEGEWGDPDCRAVLQGYTWGPANWLHIRSNGHCCDQNGLQINYGDTIWTNSTPGGNTPLFARMQVNYSCVNDNGYWPDDCKCPLELNANFYLESSLVANTNSASGCPFNTSRAQSKVENMGMAVILNQFQDVNPSPIIWQSNRIKVSSEYSSNFNPTFIFDGYKTLGNILTGLSGMKMDTSNPVSTALGNWGLLFTTFGTQISNYLNTTPPPVTINSTPKQVKNVVLVDKTIKWTLHANQPVVMQLNNFIDMFAGGEDGFNSEAYTNSGYALSFFIQPDKPNPNNPNDMYCCHEFSGGWLQHNDCFPNSSNYGNKVTSLFGGSNSSYKVPPIANDDHINSFTTKINRCNNFIFDFTKIARANVVESNEILDYKNQKLYWNSNNTENAEVYISDIMGRLLVGKKVNLSRGDIIDDLSSYDQRMVIIYIKSNGNTTKMKLQL